jgi:FkbM family methyltransferase
MCFDIGANLGQTAELLLRCHAEVVAVEPNDLCMQTLAWEFGGSPRITVVKKAVGSKPGAALLHRHPSGGDSTASLREDWPWPHPDQVEVEVTTLDALMRQFGVPAFCKVDVEGYELQVFRGLSQPIKCILFEFHRREAWMAAACLHRLESICGVLSVRLADVEVTRWISEGWLTSREGIRALQDRGLGAGNIVARMGHVA